MAEEIRTSYETGKTLNASIWLLATRWNGTSMVDPAAGDTAAWKAGLVACVEKQTTDNDGVSEYTADWPGGLTLLAEYTVVFVEGSDPEPTAIPKAQQYDPTEYKSTSVANSVFTIDMDTVEALAPDDSLCTMVLSSLHQAMGTATRTIFRTDGTTVHYVGAITRDNTAVAITEVAAQ